MQCGAFALRREYEPDTTEMMTQIHIAVSSVTVGERGRAVLLAHGIPSAVIRPQPDASALGCAYAIEVVGRYTVPGIRVILESEHVPYAKITLVDGTAL